MRSDGANLYLRGISFKCAGPEKIGKCSVSQEKITSLETAALSSGAVSEILILSTCNRVEIYLVSDSDTAFEKVGNFMQEYGADVQLFNSLALSSNGVDAISHIFEVASGLQSQMVGETEILGQVKAAYARASGAGHCRGILNSVFQKAAQCAKLIRTDTEIGHGKISIGSVAAELALRIFPDLESANILLIGSGEVGRLVADALAVRGARNISVSSRTYENARILAEKINATPVEMSDVPNIMKSFDIVVCASSAKKTVIGESLTRKTIAERCGKPIFLVDLGVPPNVDVSAAKVDNVFLYNLADLSKIAAENLRMRNDEIARASQIIRSRAEALASKIELI